jgi:hypothetical protein
MEPGTIVWLGLALTLTGIVLLVRCIMKARWLKRAEIDDARFQSEIRRLIPLNALAVATGFFGLAIMIVGALL